MKITLNDIEYMVNESVNRFLKEAITGYDIPYEEPNWDYDEDDEEDEEKLERQRRIDDVEFDALVVVNESDGSVISRYPLDNPKDWYNNADIYDEAYEEIKKLAKEHKFTTFTIYGCLDGSYDDDTKCDSFMFDGVLHNS